MAVSYHSSCCIAKEIVTSKYSYFKIELKVDFLDSSFYMQEMFRNATVQLLLPLNSLFFP